MECFIIFVAFENICRFICGPLWFCLQNETVGVSQRIENGQMMMFIAEWTANFSTILQRIFTKMCTLNETSCDFSLQRKDTARAMNRTR